MRRTGAQRAAFLAGLVGLVALALPTPAATAGTDAAAPAITSAASQPATTMSAPQQAAAADFSSIFAEDDPSLDGSGWGLCATPITWSADLGTLDAAHGQAALADLQWAFDQWSAASGLTFTFVGTTTFAYDDATFTLSPADGSTAPLRQIDVAFVDDTTASRLGGQTVGLGSPSQVLPETKEIVEGTAIFRTDHAAVAAQDEDRSLYLHELGHVLGLAHADLPANVMYPIVRTQVTLGPGDVNGVRSLTKPCTIEQAA